MRFMWALPVSYSLIILFKYGVGGVPRLSPIAEVLLPILSC